MRKQGEHAAESRHASSSSALSGSGNAEDSQVPDPGCEVAFHRREFGRLVLRHHLRVGVTREQCRQTRNRGEDQGSREGSPREILVLALAADTRPRCS